MNFALMLHATFHMPNNTLVPTRKAEAPLLAAQRGMLSPSSNCSTVLKPNVTYIIFGFRYSTGELAADMYSSARPLYWDGECPSDTRERRSVDEEVAVLLSYLRGTTNK